MGNIKKDKVRTHIPIDFKKTQQLHTRAKSAKPNALRATVGNLQLDSFVSEYNVAREPKVFTE